MKQLTRTEKLTATNRETRYITPANITQTMAANRSARAASSPTSSTAGSRPAQTRTSTSTYSRATPRSRRI